MELFWLNQTVECDAKTRLREREGKERKEGVEEAKPSTPLFQYFGKEERKKKFEKKFDLVFFSERCCCFGVNPIKEI